jgi:hypothetical protein
MKIVIISNVMVMGTACFTHQTEGTGKTAKSEPTVIDVDEKIAKELIRARQAKKAPAGAKVNLEVQPPQKEDDELDAFFDELDEEEEEPE